jgi:hypothetical protein
VQRDAVSALADVLDALSIRWALIGALAANRYRVSPRSTQDVDLLLANTGVGLEALEAALRGSGWEVLRANAEADLLRLRHGEFGVADLLIAGTEYQQEALRRAHLEPLGSGPAIPVLTVEDVIIHKLIAGRSQDIADIEAILKSAPTLDHGYLDAWTRFWEVEKRWADVRARG